jgi:hypothetical protein
VNKMAVKLLKDSLKAKRGFSFFRTFLSSVHYMSFVI